MTRKQQMIDLRDKVRAGWPIDINTPYMRPFHGVLGATWQEKAAWDANEGSLDAALALHNALLPGWLWGRQYSGLMWVEVYGMPGRNDRHYGENENPARAWLLAILSALIDMEAGE